MTVNRSLIDGFGRVHSNLRISVTDRCNIRCFYCMPAENVQFSPKEELLTYEEIERFVRVVAQMGVNKLRLTGGEPLVRADLPRLVAMLNDVPGIDDIALTTNGLLLADRSSELKRAGLRRLNISLDALSAETFQRITRRTGFERVIEGIHAAKRSGFTRIKLNAVSIRGLTEDEVIPFGHFARRHDVEVRFIEFMPLDAEEGWRRSDVLSGAEIRGILEEGIAALIPLTRKDPSQPATDFRFADGRGQIGFINPVTQPFCHDCNRLRLTADGGIRNCLFSLEEWDARRLLRGGGSDAQIAALIRSCVAAKREAHGINSDNYVRPQRSMYQIGG